jgi:hypothetical protein
MILPCFSVCIASSAGEQPNHDSVDGGLPKHHWQGGPSCKIDTGETWVCSACGRLNHYSASLRKITSVMLIDKLVHNAHF